MYTSFYKNQSKSNLLIRIMVALTLVLVLLLIWQSDKYIHASIENSLYRNASSQLTAISEFRRYYSEQVVDKLKGVDIKLRPYHSNDSDAIPLPATLGIEISERLSLLNRGKTNYSVVSNFAFPGRTERTLSEFDRKALEYFKGGARDRFIETVEQEGERVYKMAVPLIMDRSCVSCHNSYPGSPKTDWKIGDVRGAQTIEIHYESWLSTENRNTIPIFALGTATLISVFLTIMLLIKRNKKAMSELTELVQEERTKNTQLIEANDRAREKEQFINTIFDTVLESVITIDEDGIIRSVNNSTERILGYRPEELIGSPLVMIVESDDALRYMTKSDDENSLTTKFSNKGIGCQSKAVCKNGKLIDVMLSISETKRGDERVFVATLSDTSQRVEYEEHLISTVEQEKRANKAKSRFLAMMSHEIRTPLNAIINLNEIVLDTELDENQFGMIKTARDSGKALSDIVNDVLDISSIEAGELTLSPHSTDIEGLFSAVSNLMTPTAQAKGLDFSYDINAPLPLHIMVDSSRLRQIIVNLVGNAVKFTEKGFVKLRVIEVLQRSERVRLRFEVEDTGAGICDADKDKLFNEFSQLERGRKNQGGTGLGLAISRRLCSMMNGSIGVMDAPSGGGLFYFEAEFAQAEIDSAEEQGETESTDLTDVIKKILVVEDSIPNQIVMKNILEKEGYDSDIAANGELAVKMAMTTDYDLILMDVSMPIMDGHEATKMLREKGFDKPIIALSAYAFADNIERSFEFGMNGYIRKPIDKSSLFSEITRIYNQHENDQVHEVAEMIEAVINGSIEMTPEEFESVLSRRIDRMQHALDMLVNACSTNRDAEVVKQCALIGNKSYLGQVASIRTSCEQIESGFNTESKPVINRKITVLIGQTRQVIGELSARRNYIVNRFREQKKEKTT